MNTIGRTARIFNRIVGFLGSLLIVVMLLYGGYSLWSNIVINHRAFVSDELLKYKPTSDDGDNELSFEELREINPDVVAWLTVDDTNIDYPVVIGENDMYYVNRDVFGEYSVSGAIFLSCMNSCDFSDEYNMVYGHHMDNGAMFGNIMDYLDEEYYEDHLTGTLYTDDKTYAISVFAVIQCDAYDEVVYGLSDFDSDIFMEYLEDNALFYDKEESEKSEKIIAMSTCASALTNGRVVVVGRLYEKNSERREEQ